MARNDPQFNVRMPDEIKQQLTHIAATNRRSINAEIISAIELWIKIHKRQLIPSSSRILTKSEQEAFDVAIDVLKRVEMEDNHGATTRVAIIIDYYGDFSFLSFIPALKISKKAGFDWKMAVCLTIHGFNVVAWLALCVHGLANSQVSTKRCES